MGLTALEVVHGFTIPQLAAIYSGPAAPKTSASASADPAALRPGERVITQAELAERLARRKGAARA